MSNEDSFPFVEICRKLISFDSTPQGSTVEVVEYLAELARKLNLSVEIQNEIQNGMAQANIIIRAEPFSPGDQEFLLQAHLDTVDPVSFALWKKNAFNPFDAAIEDDKIYGLGAAEVKLDFLCKLKALAELAKSKKFGSLKPVLVGTFGEESGMQGALKLIRKNKINARYALIGEPSNLELINSGKGFATVEIDIPIGEDEKKYKHVKQTSESTSTQTKVFSGKAAHSSTPHLGESAALKLFEYLSKMPDNVVIIEIDAGTRVNMIPNQAMVELDVAASLPEPTIKKINFLYQMMRNVESQMRDVIDPAFQPPHSTLTIGILRTFEDKIRIGGSCRILPNVKQDDYEKWMSMIQEACAKVGAEFRMQDYKRPFRTQENSAFVKAAQSELQKLGLNSECRSLASTNEASLFSRIGVECLCLGAGLREGNVHTANEHVKIKDLEIATHFYQKMIERFCI